MASQTIQNRFDEISLASSQSIQSLESDGGVQYDARVIDHDPVTSVQGFFSRIPQPRREFLFRDYQEFKLQSSGDFFRERVQILTFQPSSTLTVDFPSGEKLHSNASFAHCLGVLCATLQSEPTWNFVRTCILSLDLNSYDLYPGRVMFLTTENSQRRKRETPFMTILLVLDQIWEFSDLVRDSWAGMTEQSDDDRCLARPSKGRESFNPNSAKETSLRLTWMRKVPVYKGRFFDLYVYTFQPHTRPQPRSYGEIVVSGTEHPFRNVLITLRPEDESQQLFSQYKTHRAEWFKDAEVDDAAWDILRSICALCDVLIEDTEKYCQELKKHIRDLVYLGRSKPSSGKLQHLLCLEDCCDTSTKGLQDASVILQKVASTIEKPPDEIHNQLQEWINNSENDIEYYLETLKASKQQIADLRTMIKDQLELQSGRRTSLLTFLAAVYIPFSFMSSLFGMNLKDPLWSSNKNSPTSGNSSKEAANANSSQNFSKNSNFSADNQMNMLMNDTTESGPHLFDFKTYWYSAIPVTVATIVFPVIAGPVFRWTSKYLARHRSTWVPISMLVLIALSVGLISSGYGYPSLWVIEILGELLLGVLMLVRTAMTGKHQILWCGFASITWLCASPRIFSFRMTAIPPLVYLFLTHLEVRGYILVDSLRAPFNFFLDVVQGKKGESRREWSRLILIILYYGTAITLSMFVENSGLLWITPFFVIGVNRVIRNSVEAWRGVLNYSAYNWYKAPKEVWFWGSFLVTCVIYMTMAFMDLLRIKAYEIIFSLLPATMFFIYWVYLDHKPVIDRIFKQNFRRENRQVVWP